MAEFYDELFDVLPINDMDVDIIYPDGSKSEMYVQKLPTIGEMFCGHIVDKVIINKKYKENECEARIELIRKKD